METDPLKMTPERVEAENQRIDRAVEALTRAARKQTETLFTTFKQEVALNETDRFRSAETLESLVLSSWDAGRPRIDVIDDMRGMFVRQGTRDVLDRIKATLTIWQKQTDALLRTKPANFIAARWEGLVGEAQALLQTETKLRADATATIPATGTGRDAIVSTIDRVEQRDRQAGAKFRDTLKAIAAVRAKIAAFAAVAPDYAQVAGESLKALDDTTAGDADLAKDLGPTLAYHRTLVGTLPNAPVDLAAVAAADAAIRASQAEHPEHWTVPDLKAAYARYVDGAYGQLVQTARAKADAATTDLNGLVASASPVTGGVADRAAVAAVIDKLESGDADLKAKASRVAASLRAAQAELTKIADAAGRSAGPGADAARAADALAGQVKKADDVASTDRAATYAYHRALLPTLPADLTNVAALNAMGAAVKKAKADQPSHWSFAPLADAYAAWQGAGYAAVMRGDLGAKVAAALAAYGQRSSSKAQGEAWLASAKALSPDDVAGLLSLVATNLLDAKAVPGRSDLVAMLQDARGAAALASLPAGSLSAFNGAEMARTLGLDGEAAAYHAGLVAKFNGNRSVADLKAMKATVEAERTTKASLWPDPAKLTAWYGRQQAAQWGQLLATRLGDGKEEVARAYGARTGGEAAAAKWEAVARRLAKDRAEAEAVRDFLATGIIDPAAVRDQEAAVGFHLPGGATASDFWEDVGAVREIDEYRSTAILPFNAYRITRDLGLTPDQWAYHLGLLRQMSRNATLKDVAAIRATVVREMSARPDDWTSDKVKMLYARVQAEQLVRYVEKSGLAQTFVAFQRDAESLSPGDSAALAVRRFKREDAEGMDAVLNGGLLASNVEPLVQYFERKNVPDAMYLMSGTYWHTVARAHARGAAR